MIRKICADLLFPRRCPVCGEIVTPSASLIHSACLSRLSPVKQPTCKKCGKEVYGEGTEYCLDCIKRRRSFEEGMALLNYNEAAKHSMAAIKYKNRREYLDFYAAALDARFRKKVERLAVSALVPVPVHPSRLRHRGFNQAEELAARLQKRWGISLDRDLLVRNKKTAPQRDLDPSERLKNLKEAFGLAPGRGGDTLPESVILIDDIYTTGSTAEACARVLKRAGVRRVYVMTICIGTGR